LRTALEHLRSALTKGNLWLYVLSVLAESPANPTEIKHDVKAKYGFSPATITFYTVLYRLRREGLVKKSSDDFRAKYQITAKGKEELFRGRNFIEMVLKQTAS